MPKNKKKWIDKKNAVTFHLVHRSQQDPLAADETAPQRVLLAAPPSQGSSKKNKEEEMKFGIYFDDDYDYLQHLRESDTLVAHWEQTPEKATQEKPQKENNIQLPSSVFASEVQEDVGLLNRAAPQSGLRLDLDPDVVAAMDEDFDFDDPENQLEDDFILKANASDLDVVAEMDEDFDSDDPENQLEDNLVQKANASGPVDFVYFGDHKNRLADENLLKLKPSSNDFGYTPITSVEQRRRYKEDFNSNYNEYRKLHAVVAKVSSKFAELERRLLQEETGSEGYKKIKNEILQEYKESKKDKQYHETKKKFEYMHEKLSHIKRLVLLAKEFDDDNVNNDEDDDEDDEYEDMSDDENSAGRSSDGEMDDSLGSLNCEETKSRFTEFSMSSSVVPRNDQLTLLDDRFEKMFAEYDENEIGALDCEEIEGEINPADDMVLRLAEEEFDKRSKVPDPECRNIVLSDSDSSSIEDERLVPVQEKEQWDCESILSTYSNLYNHPKLITEPKSNKIKINSRTGMPVLDDNRLTAKNLARLGGGGEKRGPGTIISALSTLSMRNKDETPEEKRQRKAALKQYRRDRRVERKLNSSAFKEEKKRQERNMINARVTTVAIHL